jgi:hypothetical protein
MRLKGTPQELNIGSISIQSINSTAYVVRMLFNPDEETMTSGNENANRYIAGEASVCTTPTHPKTSLWIVESSLSVVETSLWSVETSLSVVETSLWSVESSLWSVESSLWSVESSLWLGETSLWLGETNLCLRGDQPLLTRRLVSDNERPAFDHRD